MAAKKKRRKSSSCTIYFKDNKPSRVTGVRSEDERADAMAFGQAFIDSLKKPE